MLVCDRLTGKPALGLQPNGTMRILSAHYDDNPLKSPNDRLGDVLAKGWIGLVVKWKGTWLQTESRIKSERGQLIHELRLSPILLGCHTALPAPRAGGIGIGHRGDDVAVPNGAR